MSIQAINWAYDQPVKGMAKFVLVTLANYADGDGYCFPGQVKLAGDTGQTDRAVRTHLAALEDQGLITRKERRRANGSRTSDGFVLNMGLSIRKGLPVDDGPTGNTRQGHRNISPHSPEKSSGPDSPDNLPENRSVARATANRSERSPIASSTQSEQAEQKDPQRVKICAHWRENQAKLKQAFGRDEYKLWIVGLVPIEDNGELLVLGVRSKFYLDRVERDYRKKLERVLHRKIQFEVHRWVKKAKKPTGHD